MLQPCERYWLRLSVQLPQGDHFGGVLGSIFVCNGFLKILSVFMVGFSQTNCSALADNVIIDTLSTKENDTV